MWQFGRSHQTPSLANNNVLKYNGYFYKVFSNVIKYNGYFYKVFSNVTCKKLKIYPPPSKIAFLQLEKQYLLQMSTQMKAKENTDTDERKNKNI